MKKFAINNSLLRPILKHMKEVIDEKALLQVLQNILIRVSTDDSITFIVSDLEVIIITKVECNNECEQEFQFLFPFAMLFKFCALAGDVDIIFSIGKSGATTLSCGNDRLEVREVLNIDDFPKMPDFTGAVPEVSIQRGFIQSMNMAAISTSKDTLRPAMTKVLLDITDSKISIVSTDAQCLYIKEFSSELTTPEQLLIGKKTIKALAAFEDTRLSWTSNHISFESGNTRVITRNHSDRFPSYRSIIPAYNPNLTVKIDELRAAIEKASITVPESTYQTTFKLRKKSGRIIIHSKNLQDMESNIEVEAEYTGEVEKVGISAKLLSKVLSQVSFDTVQLAIESSQRAILVTSDEDPTYLGLLMPMTIQ